MNAKIFLTQNTLATFTIVKSNEAYMMTSLKLGRKHRKIGWLVVFGFNTTLTAKVISWWSVTHTCFLAFSHQYRHNFSFQSQQLLFSHTSAGVRGENTPERKVASTGDRTHNHQVMSQTCSPLSHLGGAIVRKKTVWRLPAFSPFSTWGGSWWPISVLKTWSMSKSP